MFDDKYHELWSLANQKVTHKVGSEAFLKENPAASIHGLNEGTSNFDEKILSIRKIVFLTITFNVNTNATSARSVPQ